MQSLAMQASKPKSWLGIVCYGLRNKKKHSLAICSATYSVYNTHLFANVEGAVGKIQEFQKVRGRKLTMSGLQSKSVHTHAGTAD